MLFNKSLDKGTFPTAWKRSSITPIWKSGDKSDVKIYRPISILNSMAKLFEKLITSSISDNVFSSLAEEQHGFCAHKSTVTNLAIVSHFIAQALDESGQIDVVYIDFVKAFDKVPYSILVNKLHKFGFSGSLLRWIASYLHNRTQFVRLSSEIS